MSVKVCSHCGATSNETRVYGETHFGMSLCRKHHLQMSRHGKIYERTIYDPNEIVGCGDTSIIYLYDTKGIKISEAIIDNDKAELCKLYKWYLRPNGYVFGSMPKTNSAKVKLHDYVLGHTPTKNLCVDHIDGNPLNNTTSNLRIVTQQQNAMNQRRRKNRGDDSIQGVNWLKWNGKYKWIPQIMYKYKHVWLGAYDDKEVAIKKRLEAEKKYFGEFAPQKHLFEKYGIE